MTADQIRSLQDRLRKFAAERDWEQFHTPKNLVMALTGEVGELAEIFQWLTPEAAATVTEAQESEAAVSDELADVAIYLLRLADVLGVDLAAAIDAKIERNSERYPPDHVRGRADLGPLDADRSTSGEGCT